MILRRGLFYTILTLLVMAGGRVAAQSPCRFSGTFSETNLKVVVEAIAQHCDLKLSFDPDLLEKVHIDRLRLPGVAWEKALYNAMEGQDLAVKEVAPGRFVIVREKQRDKKGSGILQKVFGTVLDQEDGTPLPGVMVILGKSGSGLSKIGTLTDEAGKFDLVFQQGAGDYLEIRSMGYHISQVKIGNNPQQAIRARLQTNELELESVIVTGKSELAFQNGESQGMVMVSPRNIEAVSVLGEKDVFRTLQFLPGISSTEESSNGLFVRGGTPDQNLVLIDGVPIFNTGHFFGMFHAFNADALEKIDVARGGFNASQGGAVAGLIEIESKPRIGDTLSAGLTANLAATSAYISLPFAGKKGAFMLAGRRSYAEIFQSPFYNQIAGNVFQTGSIFSDEQAFADADSTDYELAPISNFHDFHAKAVYDFGSKGRVSASFYNGRDVVQYDFGVSEPADGYSRFSEERLSLVNNAGGIHYARKFGNGLEWNNSAYASYYRGRFFNDQKVNDDGDSLIYLAEQDNVVGQWGLRSSLNWENRFGDQFQTGIHLKSVFTTSYISDEENDLLSTQTIEIESGIHAGWLSYNWTLGERLEIVPGIRATYYGQNEDLIVEPRLQARLDAGKGFRFNAHLGIYEQFLSPIEINNSLRLGTDFLALASDSLNIQSTSSTQSGIGISYLRPGIWIDVQGYAKAIDGLERYTRSFDLNANANESDDLLTDGSGRIYGIDFLIRGHKGPWVGWAGYSISSVKHNFPDLSQGEDFPADHDHLHELKLVNIYEWRRWEFSAMWVLASGKPYSVPVGIDSLLNDQEDLEFVDLRFDQLNTQRLKAYHRLDVNAAYNFQLRDVAKGKVGLSIFNLYNRINIRDRNYSIDLPDGVGEAADIVRVDRTLLGFSPNVFFRLNF